MYENWLLKLVIVQMWLEVLVLLCMFLLFMNVNDTCECMNDERSLNDRDR